MKAVVLDVQTLGLDVDFSEIKRHVASLDCYDQTTPDEIVSRSMDADIIVVNKAKIIREHIAALPKLKLICVTATGMDNIDCEAAKEKGVVVKNVSGYSTASVAQHVMALLFSLANNLKRYERWVAKGNWQSSGKANLLDYPILELAGRTLCLIGYGTIAKQVAAIANAVGMQIIIAERPGLSDIRDGRVAFLEAIKMADVISIHCPLTDSTRGMIDAAVISQMKDEVILINTARGAIIDEKALADAMNAGKFFGVGLDVLTEEPPSKNHPLLSVSHSNYILTPHNAWGTDRSRKRLLAAVAKNIQDFVAAS